MIVDKLSNWHLYNLGEKFEAAFNFICSADLDSLTPGKYPLMEKEVIAEINPYTTKDLSDGKIEGHLYHSDIHMLITGEEYIGYCPKENQEAVTEYNSEKDFTLYKGDVSFFSMKPGMFMILFPDDLHMPGIKMNENIPVKKLVVKITM